MRTSIGLGAVPGDESPVGISEDFYEIKGKSQCQAYIGQLTRIFGEPSGSSIYAVEKFLSEESFYYEVVIRYDQESEEEREFALTVEGALPQKWDNVSLALLRLGAR